MKRRGSGTTDATWGVFDPYWGITSDLFCFEAVFDYFTFIEL
jgi:hypothetical protein